MISPPTWPLAEAISSARSTPRGVSIAEIRRSLELIEGVEDVHDLHVWSLGSQTHALASHVTIADIPPSESGRILEQITGTLRQRFQIYHATIQFEHTKCALADMPCSTVKHQH